MSGAWPSTAGGQNPQSPHDALTLDSIKRQWEGGFRDIRFEDGMYRAGFRYGGGIELEASTLEKFDFVLAAFWRRSWSRGYSDPAAVPAFAPPWDAA